MRKLLAMILAAAAIVPARAEYLNLSPSSGGVRMALGDAVDWTGKIKADGITIHFGNAANWIPVIGSGGKLPTSIIPDLPASIITSGTFADIRIASAGAWNAKENGLGNPAANGYMLVSTTGGARSWIAPPNGITSATAPLSYSSGTLSISQASTSTNGYLSSTDFNTFNNKQAAITTGSTSQYFRGDLSLATLNKAAVAGLHDTDDVIFGYIQSSGASAGFLFKERDATGADWIGYATGGIFRLYNGSDRLTLGATGNLAVTGTIGATNFSGSSAGANSGDVTLSGENYLSLSGQVITVGAVNLSGSHATGTLAAARAPAFTGDVTSSAGSLSLTIANSAVTLAKMANMATASFLGRSTAGSGAPEVLSVATAKTMLNLSNTNSGDITLSGENYLSLSGQAITVGAVNLSGTNVTGTLAAARAPAYTGDAQSSAGSLSLTVTKINGTSLASLATGILKNTTTTGVPSIAVAADFPVLNQNTTGNATTATALATGRTLSITGDLTWTSPSFDGSGNVTAAGTLATVNSNVGTFGDATHYATVTVNSKGLITSASQTVWPIFNQSTTGSAATLTTARNIGGASFNGSASIGLDSILGLSSNGFVTRTGANTYAIDASTYLSLTGNYSPSGTWNFTGSLSSSGSAPISSTGTAAGFNFKDRSTSLDWTLYASGSIARVNNATGGDVLTIGLAGDLLGKSLTTTGGLFGVGVRSYSGGGFTIANSGGTDVFTVSGSTGNVNTIGRLAVGGVAMPSDHYVALRPASGQVLRLYSGTNGPRWKTSDDAFTAWAAQEYSADGHYFYWNDVASTMIRAGVNIGGTTDPGLGSLAVSNNLTVGGVFTPADYDIGVAASYSANVVQEGDSLHQQLGGINSYFGTGSIPAITTVNGRSVSPAQGQNVAVAGYTIQNMRDNPWRIQNVYRREAGINIVVVLAGTNTLTTKTAAEVYSELEAYCKHLRATGWRVIVVGLLSRGGSNGNGTYDSQVGAVNGLIRQNWAQFADRFIDWAVLNGGSNEFNAGGYSNLTYYTSDQLHQQVAGAQKLAGYEVAVINDLLTYYFQSQRNQLYVHVNTASHSNAYNSGLLTLNNENPSAGQNTFNFAFNKTVKENIRGDYAGALTIGSTGYIALTVHSAGPDGADIYAATGGADTGERFYAFTDRIESMRHFRVTSNSGAGFTTGKGLMINYDAGTDFGFITAYDYSVGWKPILMQGSLLKFATSGTDRMQIGTSGGVSINAAPVTAHSLYVEGNASTRNLGGTAYAMAAFASASAQAADQPGIYIGYDTAGYGVIGADTQSAGTGISFWTYNAGWAQRARFEKSGAFKIGDGTPNQYGDIGAARSGGTTGVIYLGGSSAGAGDRYLYFDGTQYALPGASLVVNGTTYTSSRTVKKNIRDWTTTQQKRLRPRLFERLDSPSVTELSFVSEEVQEVLPEAVRLGPGDPNNSSAPRVLGIDPMAIIAKQEADIQALQDRVTELEKKTKP